MAEVFQSGSDPREVVRSLSRNLGRDRIDAVTLAVSVGWKAIVTSPASVTLVSPVNENKKIHIHRRSSPKKKMMDQIKQHGDPAMVKVMLDAATSGLSDREFEAVVNASVLMSGEDDVTFDLPEGKKPKVIPTPKQVQEKVKKERHIVSERPYLAHYRLGKSGGRSYPSKTTIERRWSDGTVDYACAVSTCDFTSDSHLSFRGGHWQMHVRKGEAQPVDIKEMREQVVDDPSYTEHAWSRKASTHERKVEGLKKLLEGINLQEISAEDLAEQIAAWLGDQVGGHGGPTEPLTDSQVLDRIRSLVDRGTYASQEEEIRKRDQQIEDLCEYSEQQITLVREELAQATQRAAKAEQTLQAFRELVNEATEQEE